MVFRQPIREHFLLGRYPTSFRLLLLILWSILMLILIGKFGTLTLRLVQRPSQLPTSSRDPDSHESLQHFMRSRDLHHYLDNIKLLIQPSSSIDLCAKNPVIVMVASAPSHVQQRQTIRSTWGKHQPTYFVLGLERKRTDEMLSENYLEAKCYSDLIVYDMWDHYQNLTLKTMLIVQWTLDRCPHVKFLLKTDDDVLVNPWTLKRVIEDNPNADLLGYKNLDTPVRLDKSDKWYTPRWMSSEDVWPESLCGPAYMINGKHLQNILNAAKRVPLVNLEDVYLTYLVAKSKLGLSLVDERRMSPHRPWLFMDCAYWALVTSHSLTPSEIADAWARIQIKAKQYETNNDVCRFLIYFDLEFFLYAK